MNKFTVLVTETTSNYIDWQMELMYDSFLKTYGNDKNIDFLSLIISDRENLNKNYPYFLCKNKSYAKLKDDDHYIIYDRAFSVKEYLESKTPEPDKFYLFVEADFVFKSKFILEKETDISGQQYSYMDPKLSEFSKKTINYYMKYVNLNFIDFLNYYRPIGWPFFVRENVLRKIIDRWIELTILFRSTDRDNNPLYKDWICDMFGFNIALAEKKIIPEMIDVMDMPPFDDPNREGTFYHYCYGIKNKKTNQMIFDKRSYKPWNFIPILDSEEKNLTKGSLDLINRINNFAFNKKHS